MAAPIVYRWDDGNAPVARGERRSLCDILYACLVTGYGAKPGAGWTREFVNATFDKAVFRNNPATGTGFFLRVDGAGTPSVWQHRVQGFESMSGIDDGLLPFISTTPPMLQTSNGSGTTARPWILLADDRAFYLVIWEAATTTPINTTLQAGTMFFGDVVSRYAVDSYACALTCGSPWGSYGQMSGPEQNAGTAYNNPLLAMPRKANGSVGPIVSRMTRGAGPAEITNPGMTGLAFQAGDPVLITRPYLNEVEPYTFRGFMPGFFYPCHTLRFNQLEQLSIGGKNYLSLRHSNTTSNPCNILYGLDDWRV